MLEIQVEHHDDHTICRPIGDLDAFTVATFREALVSFSDVSNLVIDLCDVPFMDSAGIGALIRGIRRAQERDGSVALACNRPALCRLLETTGFDRIVTVAPTLEDAVQSLDLFARRT